MPARPRYRARTGILCCRRFQFAGARAVLRTPRSHRLTSSWTRSPALAIDVVDVLGNSVMGSDVGGAHSRYGRSVVAVSARPLLPRSARPWAGALLVCSA